MLHSGQVPFRCALPAPLNTLWGRRASQIMTVSNTHERFPAAPKINLEQMEIASLTAELKVITPHT